MLPRWHATCYGPESTSFESPAHRGFSSSQGCIHSVSAASVSLQAVSVLEVEAFPNEAKRGRLSASFHRPHGRSLRPIKPVHQQFGPEKLPLIAHMRRSSTLKSYAGDTSLPGGRHDPGDISPEDTARREAFEEIGLPRNEGKVPLLCVLEPFLSGNQLIVTPVVVLINDATIEPVLNRPEVESLFSHPLHSFLSKTPPFTMASILPDAKDQSWDSLNAEYYTYHDLKWVDNERKIRMHRFLTGKEGEGIKPIFGLTASILIRVAQIGYGRSPAFPIHAPEQPSMGERIDFAMRHHPLLQDAAKEEGLNEWCDDNDETGASTFILRGRL